ncbi:E3 ubiquitin-protein ligase [Cricetulus griseus]|uniref:E3 ubiquitin-protein ligase n=1 Tax=Cricetulus griseus TaxID=10029 RepID=A0A061HYC3_CRIGR|nr:E3 ubiquitin-protein ligase [Cricetulus griseus]
MDPPTRGYKMLGGPMDTVPPSGALRVQAGLPEERVGSPETGVMSHYKPPCGSWELNSGTLKEQQDLFTTKPSLQQLNHILSGEVFSMFKWSRGTIEESQAQKKDKQIGRLEGSSTGGRKLLEQHRNFSYSQPNRVTSARRTALLV